MADDVQQLRGIHWREAFPFTHLFRAFRVSIHPSKLFLGLIALFALYIGGQVLDSIWSWVSPASLAVPAEVYLYQKGVTNGATSDQFINERQEKREAIEDAYSRRLLEEKIVASSADADKAAAKGDDLDKVKAYIIDARDRRVADAQNDYKQAYAAANSIPEKDKKNRAQREAYDAYQASVRTAYAQAYEDLSGARDIRGVGLFQSLFAYESERINGVIRGVEQWNWLGTARDDRGPGVIDSIIDFFRIGPVWLMRFHPAYFTLYTLWFLTIWGIFGGAIARLAAIHIARDESLSVRSALAFSMGKFLSFVSAPLIPLVIVLAIGLIPLIAGLLSSIPYLGPVVNIIMGLLFVLFIIAGFVMTLVLLLTFAGFNLMYPTVAVEGSDSFDAISRSFGYVFRAPWRMLFYTLVAIVYGALCYLFVRLFIWMTLSLVHYFVGAGFIAHAPSTAPLWPEMWPGPETQLSYTIHFLSLRGDQSVAAALVAFWVYIFAGLLGAFVISFYFTSNTIIYFLMRYEADATEMDDVYIEQGDEDFTDTTVIVNGPASATMVVDDKPALDDKPVEPPPAQA